MSTCPITYHPIIEATDEYFIEHHAKWFPVPKHWIGDFVHAHSFKIRPRG